MSLSFSTMSAASSGILLCSLSSAGFASDIFPFKSSSPCALSGVNLSEPVYSWSPDREMLAINIGGDRSVGIFTVKSIQQGEPFPIVVINESTVSYIAFSAKSTWLCTWRKPTSETDMNMAIWSLSTGECVFRCRRKRLDRLSGAPAQWSSDEKTVWVLSGSELLGYVLSPTMSSNDPSSLPYKFRLHIPEMTMFWLSPIIEPTYRVLVLIAGKNGQPARSSIYNLDAPDVIVCSKSFFQSDNVEAIWSPAGHAVLVKAAAAHDATGKSYYGSASLFLLPADGHSPPVTIVSAGTDGACADVQWNPVKSKREFAVICGRRAFICASNNAKCVLDLGRNAWNTVRWSPSGRYIAVGGFGNLPGNLWFFDRTARRFLGCGSDHGSKFVGWAADSQCVLTARMFPARRVDNGFTVFSFSGDTLAKHEFDKLLDVQLLSLQPVSDFPNVPPSQDVIDRSQPIEAAEAACPSGAKAGAYLPPKAREQAAASGKPVATGVSELLRQLRNDGAKSAGPTVAANVVSKTEDPKKAIRNKARRERRAKAKTTAENDTPDETAGAQPVDDAKAIKSLLKKLRQIEQLKIQVRDCASDLLPEQKEKLSKEQDIIDQLSLLGHAI